MTGNYGGANALARCLVPREGVVPAPGGTHMAPETDRERRLDEILADYLDAVAVGRAPDRQELLARHPDLADELTAFFRDQDRGEGVYAPLRTVPSFTMTCLPASASACESVGPWSRCSVVVIP